MPAQIPIPLPIPIPIRTKPSPSPSPLPMSSGPLTNPFLPTQEAQRMMGGSYPESDVARASLWQMNEISRRAEVAGMSFAPVRASGSSTSTSTSRLGEATERDRKSVV